MSRLQEHDHWSLVISHTYSLWEEERISKMHANERTALFALILLTCAPLQAQSSAGIAGRVVDPQGLGVPDAIVTLYARPSGARLSVTTNAEGSYRFDRLVYGEYLVEAEAPGFSTTTKATRV